MAGKRGRKNLTQKKSGNSTRARENVAPVVEEHVEEQSDGNNSDDLSPDLCEPSEGRKRKNPSSIPGGVSTRTRARKAVSDGNEQVGENLVHEESTRVREKTAVSLSLDSESEDMSVASSKLEVMDWRMSKLERNQRLLRSRAKKIEDRLTSIESKGNEAEENNYGEDMDFEQWDNMDCGRLEGLDKTAPEENYFDRAKGKDKDTGVQEKQQPREDGEKEAEEEQEKEVQDGDKEAEKEPKETPTPPRGRTKAVAARKLVHTPPEKFFQFVRPSEEEELASEEESPTKEAATPAKKKAKDEKKKVDGAPKKRGRPKKTAVTLKPCTPLPKKRKGEPSRWVQSPFTEGKTDELEVQRRSLKQRPKMFMLCMYYSS
ncbi:hypothetical protein Bca4012_028661 [Brassica carinata]